MHDVKLIIMNDIKEEKVEWLWYRYIPKGKLTIIQGDPGNGKTNLILAIAAALTTGKPLPHSRPLPPMNVIYQTAEDGLSDTIKPRLVKAGANCNRVMVIDESEQDLTMLDERIEEAIVKANAGMFVLDPIQAFIGAGTDMYRTNAVRPILKKLAGVAERTKCAIVIIGHLNKGNSKSAYRGNGSIDFSAGVRSVLLVGRMPDKPNTRVVIQQKNNLAAEGGGIMFSLDNGFQWLDKTDITVEELLKPSISQKGEVIKRAEQLLLDELSGGAVLSKDIVRISDEHGISKRTLDKAKLNLNVQSIKRNNLWYWELPKKNINGEEVINI